MMAAWLPSWCLSVSLGRFHRGAGLFVTACPEIGGMGGKAHVFAARERVGAARVRHSRQKTPRPWGKAGATERAIPLGGGEYVALSVLTVTNDPQFLAGGVAVNPVFACRSRQRAA